MHRLVQHQRRLARQRGRGVGQRQPGRQLRPAAHAGPETLVLGAGGIGKEAAIGLLGRPHPAHRAAVDAGGGDADEQPAVEARIARTQGAVVGVVLALNGISLGQGQRWGGERRHGPDDRQAAACHSPFSDLWIAEPKWPPVLYMGRPRRCSSRWQRATSVKVRSQTCTRPFTKGLIPVPPPQPAQCPPAPAFSAETTGPGLNSQFDDS